MKTILTILICACALATQAQKESFDTISYTLPTGWKKEVKNNVLFFSKEHDSSWCVIAVYKSAASKGSVDLDFDHEWIARVAARYQSVGQPQKSPAQQGNDWKTMTGSGSFVLNNAPATATLTAMTGHNTCVSIVSLTNTSEHTKDVEQFISSIDLSTPSDKAQ